MPHLRRAFAVVLLLSVSLSTLARADAPCSELGRGPATVAAVEAIDHGASHRGEAPARDHCEHPRGPADEQSADGSCLLVAHCATAMMIASPTMASFVRVTPDARVTSRSSAPTIRALEPDSPPPRG